MSRSVSLAFACLACFLVLVPLSLKKPGLPMRLSGEEATYLSMAASLGLDGDVRCDDADLARLFSEFPFAEVGLELESDDGWTTARYARPLVYPLLAAPWVALWGANGAIALNAALFLLAVACGWLHLRRFGSDGVALLFSLGFFLFSTAFVYLFRIQSQMLVMAAVAVAMVLGWRPPEDEHQGPSSKHRWWISGAALGLAILQEPALAVLALPLLGGLIRSRRSSAWSWLTGCAAMLLLGSVLSTAWTGKGWPGQLAFERTATTFQLDSPLEVPWRQLAGTATGTDSHSEAAAEAGGTRRSAVELFEDASLFLWGRRAGILPYFPLLLPLLLIFGFTAWHCRQRWYLLAALAALGLLQLTLEPVSLALHDGDVGNPHMVGVYPAILFLITRLRPPAVLVSYGLGALITGSMVLTTLGVVVPDATVHSHTRNFPFTWLPFEYPALGRASGLHQVEIHGLEAAGFGAGRLWAPADQSKVRGDELWLLGGESVELWLESRVELPSAVFQLRNLAPHNRVSLRMSVHREERELEEVPPAGISFRLDLEPGRPDKIRRQAGPRDAGPVYYYRLRLETRHGEKPKWRQGTAADDYLGVALSFLGTPEFLDRDLYAVDWLGCGAPARVRPEEAFLAVARLSNSSAHPWPHRGPARVRLSYRWLDAAGREIPDASERTELSDTVEPGQLVASWLSVRAPRAPGRYLLEIDPLFENVAWFSHRNPQATCHASVEVGD